MQSIHQTCLWNGDEVRDQMLAAVQSSFDDLKSEPNFDNAWHLCQSVAGTKTSIRQSPLLGRGGGGRAVGGFWKFAEKYVSAEGGDPVSEVYDRCCFERYNDFQFYTAGNWYAGKKRLLVIAEAETKNAELLGELSTLLSVNCPFKFLFITESPDILGRLNSFSSDSTNDATDFGGTTYFVVEIPNAPSPPRDWRVHRADVERPIGRLSFRTILG